MRDHRWIRKGLGLLSLSVMLLFTGCSGNEKKTEEPEIAEVTADETAIKEIKSIAGKSDELTVWSAYWDCEDDIETLEESMDDIDQISLFEAYCKDGELMIPDATERMLKKIRRREILQDKTVFLSVVNDVEKNGKTIQKDTEILKKWMGDEESAQTHAEELVRLAADNGFDGIEVDYEKIRSDMELWKNFIDFEKRLLEEAEKGLLQVRIVLEPGTPVDELEFPEGASYVVMCYNLYGNGTEPGPKADLDFLSELYEKFKDLPDVSFALSNGGFDWENGSDSPVQKKRTEIEELQKKYKATPERDTDSGALHFTYKEGSTQHEVWYADEETLGIWTEKFNTLSGGKAKISLWRI